MKKRLTPVKGTDFALTSDEPADPQGLRTLALDYLEDLAMANFSPVTVSNRRKYLRLFFAWCGERGIRRIDEVIWPVIERYKRALYYHRQKNGMPLSARSRHSRLEPLRSFFAWLVKKHRLVSNPTADLELPRLPRSGFRETLNVPEVEQVMAQPDLTDLLGVRDRTLLETLYATGIRRKEVAHLALDDLDQVRGSLRIRFGKGRRERLVPIGERALTWIRAYLATVRPLLVKEPDPGWLFLTTHGKLMSLSQVTRQVRKYLDAAGSHKKGACHLFRHTVATAMLDNGADIRYIQHLLGHADLSTTQVYTHVSMRRMREVYNQTHPAAGLTDRKRTVPKAPAEPPTDDPDPLLP